MGKNYSSQTTDKSEHVKCHNSGGASSLLFKTKKMVVQVNALIKGLLIKLVLKEISLIEDELYRTKLYIKRNKDTRFELDVEILELRLKTHKIALEVLENE